MQFNYQYLIYQLLYIWKKDEIISTKGINIELNMPKTASKYVIFFFDLN